VIDSDQWRDKRVLVLKRACGMCEGCGQARAREVHHKTYQHLGAEFLFELVALCVECHRRIHSEPRQTDQPPPEDDIYTQCADEMEGR